MRRKAGRGFFGWLVALLLGSSFLALPFLLSLNSPTSTTLTGNQAHCMDPALVDLSRRLVELNDSASRSLAAQGSVDLGRAAGNLDLEKGIDPYKKTHAADGPLGCRLTDGGAVEADTYSASLALLALTEQSQNGTNASVVHLARDYERSIGQKQNPGQEQGQVPAPDQDGLNSTDSFEMNSLDGSWAGDGTTTALASYALQKSSTVTGTDNTAAVSEANDWLTNHSAKAEQPPIELAFASLALSDDPVNRTYNQYKLALTQTEDGNIADPETTAWAAVALTESDQPELLASAGKAVNWLAAQDGLNDSNVALAAYAQERYEQRYLEVRLSMGNCIPRPASLGPEDAYDGLPPEKADTAIALPSWLSATGLAMLLIGAMGLFARMRGEKRILSGVRHRILEYLRGEPGQDQTGIQRELGLSTGSAVYNLNVLSDKGYLTVHRDGRHKRYYVNGNGLRPVANGMTKFIVSALRNVNTKRIAVYLLERPGAPQKEVSEKLQLDPSTVHWHAERLMNVGVLSSMRVGRNVAYRINRPDIIYQILSFIP